jgi:hypothetical protein
MQTNIIKGFVLCLAMLLFRTGFAQKPIWGIFGGPQMTSAYYSVNKVKQPTDFKTGFQAGVTVKALFENRLYFSPAAYYSLKGYKVTFNMPSFPPATDAINNETTIHTLEIAPLLHYDFSPKPAHFFIKAGPAFDLVFAGHEKFDTKDRKHIDRSMKFSFADYGRITGQLVFHFGYETVNGFFVFAHYGRGFGSLNNADDGPRIKHRIAGISGGWYFHKSERRRKE